MYVSSPPRTPPYHGHLPTPSKPRTPPNFASLTRTSTLTISRLAIVCALAYNVSSMYKFDVVSM